MNQKPKKCKGINKAHGYEGCGKEVLKRTYGLCPYCLWDWMQNTEAGRIHYKKQFIPRVEKRTQKEIRKKERQRKEKTKVELMSADDYRAKYIQPKINKIARMIDQGHPCIATGNFGKMNGGHYISVGANRTTALNLHNIFIQSFESNHFKSGDTLKYQNGLKQVFGEEYFEFVESLKSTPPIKFTKEDFKQILPRLKKISQILENDDEIRNPTERIRLRNWANKELGVYKNEQSEFKLI